MERKPIWEKRIKIIALALFTTLILSVSIQVLAATDPLDVTYTDPRNDLRCFTKEQIEEFTAEYDEPPEDFDELMSMIKKIWINGELSAAPDYIDMILIRLVKSGLNIKLIITVEGNVSDSDNIYIMIWGNCTDGNGIAGAGGIQNDMEGSESYYAFVDMDGNPISNGTIDINGGTMEMEFPASAWTNQSCSLYIMMMTTLNDETLCADIFPNSLVGEPTGSTGPASLLDPLLEMLTNLYYWLSVNWWLVLAIIVIVIALMALYIYYRNSKSVQEQYPTRKKRTLK